MGRPGIEWMATLDQYSGFAITTDHRAVWSDGFGQLLDVR
jgi:hypothetical protein